MSGDVLTLVLFLIGLIPACLSAMAVQAGWKHPLVIPSIFLATGVLGLAAFFWIFVWQIILASVHSGEYGVPPNQIASLLAAVSLAGYVWKRLAKRRKQEHVTNEIWFFLGNFSEFAVALYAITLPILIWLDLPYAFAFISSSPTSVGIFLLCASVVPLFRYLEGKSHEPLRL